MLYPFIVIIILYLSGKTVDNPIRKKIVTILFGLIISVSLLVCIALPFVPQLSGFSHIPYLSVIGGIISISIFYLFLRFKSMRILAVIASMVLLRWIFNFTVSPVRQTQSNASVDKQDAQIIALISGDEPVYVLSDTRISYTTLFYLEAKKEEVIFRVKEPETARYYLSDPEYLEGVEYNIIHSFKYHDNELIFIRVK